MGMRLVEWLNVRLDGRKVERFGERLGMRLIERFVRDWLK